MRNTSGIAPTEFNVLIMPEVVEERTAGGIIKPQDVREREQAAAIKGRIVAASPLAFTYEDWPDPSARPKVGDRVLIAKYAGLTVEGADGKQYRVLKDKDVAALLIEETQHAA